MHRNYLKQEKYGAEAINPNDARYAEPDSYAIQTGADGRGSGVNNDRYG